MSSRAAVAAPAAPSRRIGHGAPPLTVPRGPRRVSGPARRAIPDRRVRRRANRDGGIVLGLIGALEGVAQHRLLDRLLAGRTWIALVAFALIGIVTMQLGLLKLNGGIGRAIEREALLQRENAALSIENSELAAGDRVQSRATRLGMEFAPAGALRFLAANPRIDLARGAAALSASVQAPPRSSEESSAASTTAAPAQASGAEAQAPPSGASSGSGESPSGASEESTAGPQSTPAAPAQSTPAPPESTTASAESTRASAGTAPASAPSSSTAPTGSGSAEAAPAGGTQAGPQG